MPHINGTDTVIDKDIDILPRPVMALGVPVETKNWEHARHSHRKAQLLFTVSGIVNCEIEDGVWIVPPQCAVWIPAALSHAARGSGKTECYCLFVEPDASPDLPKSCCTLSVSPLLRELLQRAVSFPALYELNGREGRLIATLLDELTAAPVCGLHLPMPRDKRLRRLAEMLQSEPANKLSLPTWAARIGMSERSLTRLLLNEIGMSFGQWRRQLHVIIALQRLTRGESVKAVAFNLGYENASGFVTMFRKTAGKPPARYLSDFKAKSGIEDNQATVVPGIILTDTTI
ncbi:AraC family transcriptional regulator [Desulfobacter curvatus]|uniref:AraC family transcriptional regulator n=1 Tax=Desulfobacter curvatus TaxID=2290 RepID=UPI0003817EB4|nr:helix-turn-helix transcriptional regulator [Desulfobacter curvatus]